MIKKIGVTIIAGLLCSASAFAAGRSEVLLTSEADKAGGSTYALDFYSDGSVAGFQFDIDGVGKNVDLSKCGAKVLAAGFAGGCTMREGFVRVLFYSGELKSLAEGWHDLGTVTVKGSAKNVRLKEVNVSDAYGKAIEAGARIEGAGAVGLKAK